MNIGNTLDKAWQDGVNMRLKQLEEFVEMSDKFSELAATSIDKLRNEVAALKTRIKTLEEDLAKEGTK